MPTRFQPTRFSVLLALAGALLAFVSPAARAGSTTFAFAAAASAQQYYKYESGDYSASVTFTLYGGTSNVGLTAGAAKTIHVGYGDVETDADLDFQYDNEPLPHTLSLTGAGATVTQTLPQTDDLDDAVDEGNLSVDIHAGPTVTFDMGTQDASTSRPRNINM